MVISHEGFLDLTTGKRTLLSTISAVLLSRAAEALRSVARRRRLLLPPEVVQRAEGRYSVRLRRSHPVTQNIDVAALG